MLFEIEEAIFQSGYRRTSTFSLERSGRIRQVEKVLYLWPVRLLEGLQIVHVMQPAGKRGELHPSPVRIFSRVY